MYFLDFEYLYFRNGNFFTEDRFIEDRDFYRNNISFRNGWEVYNDKSIDTCNRCNKITKEGNHTCPFQEDVNSDEEFECNCCNDCTEDCALSI